MAWFAKANAAAWTHDDFISGKPAVRDHAQPISSEAIQNYSTKNSAAQLPMQAHSTKACAKVDPCMHRQGQSRCCWLPLLTVHAFMHPESSVCAVSGHGHDVR